jgi:hypothetical protein
MSETLIGFYGAEKALRILAQFQRLAPFMTHVERSKMELFDAGFYNHRGLHIATAKAALKIAPIDEIVGRYADRVEQQAAIRHVKVDPNDIAAS